MELKVFFKAWIKNNCNKREKVSYIYSYEYSEIAKPR